MAPFVSSSSLRPSRSVTSKRSTARPSSPVIRAECTSTPAAANALASACRRPGLSGALTSHTVCHGDAPSSNITTASGNGTDARGASNEASIALRRAEGSGASSACTLNDSRAAPSGQVATIASRTSMPNSASTPVTLERRPDLSRAATSIHLPASSSITCTRASDPLGRGSSNCACRAIDSESSRST